MVHGLVSRCRAGHGPGDDGAVLLLFILLLLGMLTMSALVIDLGSARQAVRAVQNDVDAAALAGARDLPPFGPSGPAATTATATAAHYAGVNFDATPAGTACPGSVPPNTTCYRIADADVQVSTPYTMGSYPSYRLIHVQACRPGDSFFATAVGQSSPILCRGATALLTPGVLGPAILVLDPSVCPALEVGGSAQVEGHTGSVDVNSTCSTSALLTHDSPAHLKADPGAGCVCVVGGASQAYPANTSPAATTSAATVPDPYAGVPAPAKPSTAGSCSANACTAGFYGSMTLTSPTTFAPGIYYFDGLLKLEGSGAINAPNVLFYFHTGGFDIASGTNFMSALSSSQDPANQYAGITIFGARGNTSQFLWYDLAHAGTTGSGTCSTSATSGILGAVYLPSSFLYAHGNGSTFCASDRIVTKTMKADENTYVMGTAPASGQAAQSISLVK